MYVNLQENGKCHIADTEPRFKYSQKASPCLQPWRRYNLKQMLPEYPQEEVMSPSLPPAHAKSQCAVELCWFWTRLVSSLWGRMQLIGRWCWKATDPTTVTWEEAWQEGSPCSAQAFKLSQASGAGSWQPHFAWEEICLQGTMWL